MAPRKPVNFFTWEHLERILNAVARETPESEAEYLAWLRTIHFISLSIISVFRASSNFLNFSPRSALGETAYKTFVEVAAAYRDVVKIFPQAELPELLEILEESVPVQPEPE